jgi:hypothetical protein
MGSIGNKFVKTKDTALALERCMFLLMLAAFAAKRDHMGLATGRANPGSFRRTPFSADVPMLEP